MQVTYVTQRAIWCFMPACSAAPVLVHGVLQVGCMQRTCVAGPIIAPCLWSAFPNPGCVLEATWSQFIARIRAYVVHTSRVAEHLAERSNTTMDRYA